MYRLLLTVGALWGAFLVWTQQDSLGTIFGAITVAARDVPRSRSGGSLFKALEPEALYGSASRSNSATQRFHAQAPVSSSHSKFESPPTYGKGSSRKPLRSVAGPARGRLENIPAHPQASQRVMLSKHSHPTLAARGVNGPVSTPVNSPIAKPALTGNALHSRSLSPSGSASLGPAPQIFSRRFAPLPSKPYPVVEAPQKAGSLPTMGSSGGTLQSAPQSMANVGSGASASSVLGSRNQHTIKSSGTAATEPNRAGAFPSASVSHPTGPLPSVGLQSNAINSRAALPGALPSTGSQPASLSAMAPQSASPLATALQPASPPVIVSQPVPPSAMRSQPVPPSAMRSQPAPPSAMASHPPAPSAIVSHSAPPVTMKSEKIASLPMKSQPALPYATQSLPAMPNAHLRQSQPHNALMQHPLATLDSQSFKSFSKDAAQTALPQTVIQRSSHEPLKPYLAEEMKVHLSVFRPYTPGAENCYNVWEELNSNPEIGGRVFLLYNIIKAVGPESRITPADSATSDKEVRVALQELYSLGLDLLPYFDRIATCEVEPIAGHTLYQRFILLGLTDSCRTQFTKEVLSQDSPIYKPQLQLDKEGNTLLHLAVLSGSLSMIDAVIEREHQRRSLHPGENPLSGHYWVAHENEIKTPAWRGEIHCAMRIAYVMQQGKRPVDLASILGIQSQLKHKFRCLTYFLRKNIDSQNLSSATFRELTNALDTASAQMASADVLQAVNAQA